MQVTEHRGQVSARRLLGDRCGEFDGRDVEKLLHHLIAGSGIPGVHSLPDYSRCDEAFRSGVFIDRVNENIRIEKPLPFIHLFPGEPSSPGANAGLAHILHERIKFAHPVLPGAEFLQPFAE